MYPCSNPQQLYLRNFIKLPMLCVAENNPVWQFDEISLIQLLRVRTCKDTYIFLKEVVVSVGNCEPLTIALLNLLGELSQLA